MHIVAVQGSDVNTRLRDSALTDDTTATNLAELFGENEDMKDIKLVNVDKSIGWFD